MFLMNEESLGGTIRMDRHLLRDDDPSPNTIKGTRCRNLESTHSLPELQVVWEEPLLSGWTHEGWEICVADINDSAALETVTLIEKAGGSGFAEHLDVTDPLAWASLSTELRRRWPTLDLLVNNAGVAGAGLVGSFSLDDWKWVIDVNLWSVIYGCHTFVDWLKQNPEGGHIINTASFAGIASAPNGRVQRLQGRRRQYVRDVVGRTERGQNRRDRDLSRIFPDQSAQAIAIRRSASTPICTTRFDKSPFTADDVAQAAIESMKRGKLYVVLPSAARYRWYFKRFHPQGFLNKVAQIMARATGGKAR